MMKKARFSRLTALGSLTACRLLAFTARLLPFASIAVLLASAPTARAQVLYLDLNTSFFSGFGTGSGTYDWGAALWSSNPLGTSSTFPWAANSTAIFGASGTYTMSLGTSAFTVGGIAFNDADVTIGNGTSGTLALSVSPSVTAEVASGRTATINAALSGAGTTTLSKTGAWAARARRE